MKIDEIIKGNSIRIRSYCAEDLDFVRGMWFDGENGRYLGDPTEEYIDDVFQKAVDGLEDEADGWYFIAELESGERIGSCSVFPDKSGEVYDIGYCVHRAFWKKGFGSEIISALEAWIFGKGAKKITAQVAKENVASNALLRKFGYQVARESEFRKYNMDISYESFIYEKSRV